MHNCFLCNQEGCSYAGIDGNWAVECPYLPPEEIDEEERHNFDEYMAEIDEREAEEEAIEREVRRRMKAKEGGAK